MTDYLTESYRNYYVHVTYHAKEAGRMIRKVGAGILYGLALYVYSFALLLVFIMSYLFVTSGDTLLVTVCVMLLISVGVGVYSEVKGGDDRSEYENTTQE